jgi:hypothetical protein
MYPYLLDASGFCETRTKRSVEVPWQTFRKRAPPPNSLSQTTWRRSTTCLARPISDDPRPPPSHHTLTYLAAKMRFVVYISKLLK